MRTERSSADLPADAVAEAVARLGVTVEPQNVEDHLGLIGVASEVERQGRVLLQEAVTSARSAGATWSAVGQTLGMSKQAAQKRFATPGAPGGPDLDQNERILGPTTTFDEMRELALAGRYGWHSVAFGPYYHRVVRSTTQWEHARVARIGGKARAMQEDGWALIGSEFPYVYLKRDLGTPALTEPV